MATSPCETGAVDPAALAALADGIAARGLALPAAIVLQIARPFGFLCGHVALLLEPLVGSAAGRCASILSDAHRVDALLNLLDAHIRGTDIA